MMKIKIDEDVKTTLEGMGFEEDSEKKGLYRKQLSDNKMCFWDFRKTDHGRFYSNELGGDFIPDDDAKQMEEYVVVRKVINGESKKGYEKIVVKKQDEKQSNIVLRGNEEEISSVVMQRNLEMIKRASKDPKHPGKGILYYDEKIGDFQLVEPSVELVDLISAQMGNISVEIVEKGQCIHRDIESGDEFQTYYAIVKARDNVTGAEGLGSAEEIIDFKEMSRKNNPRTFALTKAIRKAERNAKERLIPVPRRAMVELVKEIMKKV